MPEKIEEDLRTRIYEALVELGPAGIEEKAGIVERLSAACGKLHALIIFGKIRESVAVTDR